MVESHSTQIDNIKIRSRLVKQVLWFMLWPTLTVLLVVSAVYFDRMYVLKDMTSRWGVLLVEATGNIFLKNLRVVESDIKYLANSPAVQDLFAGTGNTTDVSVKEMLEELVSTNNEYHRISLLDSNGKELTRMDSTKNQEDKLEYEFQGVEKISGYTVGKIYVFAIQHQEVGISHEKKKPAVGMRFVKAVVAGAEGIAGLIVIDYCPSGLFDSINQAGSVRDAHLYFIGQNGDIVTELRNENAADHVFPDYQNDQVKSYTDKFPEVWEAISQKGNGHVFLKGSSYAFSPVLPLSERYAWGRELLTDRLVVPDPSNLQYQIFLVAEIPESYFKAQKKYYIRFLIILSVILLIPSIVVCVFLARSRTRVRIEEELRYCEHEKHLAELEEKVKQRTRELDDSNLQLSAEIAERLTSESRLRRSNELLTGMIESIDGIIYVADIETHEILFANEYVKRLFGFDPVGRKCWQFIHSSQDGPCVFCNNNKLLDDSENPAKPCHWEYQNPFNKKWYAAKDQAIRWSNGKLVRLEIAIDITEHKRLEHFLQEARKQAEVAMGARSRFVALVAHDLKSPFFSITQMLRRILERETFTHKVHRQFLENIVENGHRMLQMIDNLLSIDRFESGEVKLDKTFFDVSEMADDVLQSFRHPAFEKGIKLMNSIPEESMVYADRYLYFMVLNNMISNAVKFSERGGTVKLLMPGGANSMCVAVRDTGGGMNEEYIQDLFRADVKTSSQGTGGERGSGLGLIFCQDIIKAHHGVVRVESERGVGSTFYIDLPECCRLAVMEKLNGDER